MSFLLEVAWMSSGSAGLRTSPFEEVSTAADIRLGNFQSNLIFSSFTGRVSRYILLLKLFLDLA
jgi:hypothetical protein